VECSGNEPLAHELLELHPLLNDRVASAAVQKRLFNARENAT
jgi:hypothetical protein